MLDECNTKNKEDKIKLGQDKAELGKMQKGCTKQKIKVQCERKTK